MRRCVECGACERACPILNKKTAISEKTEGYIIRIKNEQNNLTEVVETKNIVKTADGAEADGVAVDMNSLVSMNMWGLGTFQLSDIFYNTVGGLLGGLMYCAVMKARKRL